jgi:hypothetical protein
MEEILNSARSEMNAAPQTPRMWPQIQREISKDKKNIFDLFPEIFSHYKLTTAMGFAIVVIVLSVTIFSLTSPRLISVSKAEKLANNIDEQVYEAQKIYESVIAEMEQKCKFSELTTDNDLAQAYFDKLHLLDQMILVCKSSLKDNPYNPVIHKQIIFAYNQKIKVYKELQNLDERNI